MSAEEQGRPQSRWALIVAGAGGVLLFTPKCLLALGIGSAIGLGGAGLGGWSGWAPYLIAACAAAGLGCYVVYRWRKTASQQAPPT